MPENARPYLAVLLFGSSSPAPGYRPLYREDLTLVHAASAEQARAEALDHARRQETTHRNAAGEEITVRLLEVVDVTETLDDDLTRTADLYARHFHDIDAYRAFDRP
ncbi:DUF4288 domain-containing protein [Pseudonocardia acaciae]|uniref:DUF4288 domain-containing protein n=1 Tax=Pseudonocardia acaciae TaxID=551276 RepID=UPI0005667EC2|nr:DUF4288 domain-containing protein [Pseudonocardia acaciae]